MTLPAAPPGNAFQPPTDAALAALNARIYRDSPIGILVADASLRVRLCNPAFCALLGYPEDEIRGTDFPALVHPDDRPESLAAAEALRSGQAQSRQVEHRCLRRDGDSVWVQQFIVLLPGDGAGSAHFLVLAIDIGSRKALEQAVHEHRNRMERLLQQQVALQTAAALAHELNQPLVSIAVYADVALRAIRDTATPDPRLVRALEGGHAQAQRAGRVLHELLEHLQRGEAPTHRFDLVELAAAVVRDVRITQSRMFDVACDVEPGLPAVLGSRLQTEKVLGNLLRNGLDAMDEAGVVRPSFRISLRTQPAHDMVEVVVHDRGGGLDPAAAARAFDPFFSTKP